MQKFDQYSESDFNIRITQQRQHSSKLFGQFQQDLRLSKNISLPQNKNFLATTTNKKERKASIGKSKDKKRMKLIDYIYIKNTSKKNQKSSKVQKNTMSANQLRKSRLKQGKQKAFKAIVQQIAAEFKTVSSKASVMAELISQNVTYSGNTEQIGKLCNIRRIINDHIIGSLAEIQKLMGVEDNYIDSASRQKINQQEQDDLNNRIKRLQLLGVQRLEEEPQAQVVRAKTDRHFNLKVANKLSNKDTAISQLGSQKGQF